MKLSLTAPRALVDILHTVIIVLSVLLIVFISIDTFSGENFLQNAAYMRFQFWVCMVFVADFFIELALTARGSRWRYFRHRVLFLLLSVPYLSIVNSLGLVLDPEELFFVRFIPLARGVLAMAIVVGYISANRVTSLLASYIVVVAAVVYFASLIFLYREHGVNPAVTGYGQALWWAATTCTTLGCSINPMTPTGKVLAVAVAGTGIVMFPLFTVYFTSLIMRYKERVSKAFSLKK